MATVTWLGTSSSAWATGANWSGGSEPSNDDTVIIDGAVSIDGVDKSSVHLDYLIIRPTYTGQFGSSAANPVKIAVDNACDVQGGSAVYLNSGGSNPIVALTVKMPTPQTVFDIGGTVTKGAFHRGKIYSAATFTNLALEPMDDNPLNLPQPTLTGGTITTLDTEGVELWITTATTITTLNQIEGTVFNYAGTLTTVNVIGRNAEFKHFNTATITTVNAKKGGYFNASVDGRAKTVTNITRTLGGVVNNNNGVGTITVTNGVKTSAGIADNIYGAR